MAATRTRNSSAKQSGYPTGELNVMVDLHCAKHATHSIQWENSLSRVHSDVIFVPRKIRLNVSIGRGNAVANHLSALPRGKSWIEPDGESDAFLIGSCKSQDKARKKNNAEPLDLS